MFKTIYERIKQGYKTQNFPAKIDTLPERFQGLPVISDKPLSQASRKCVDICPTDAITLKDEKISLDLGKCIFCGECEKACTAKEIIFTRDYRLSSTSRNDLILGAKVNAGARQIRKKIKNIFGRSLKLRQVSAGGCNACELDVNVLNTVGFDLGRFGIQLVASPRQADGLLITGPVTKNMRLALEKTYNAVPSPKLVIAVGACAISGGPYIDHEEAHNGAGSIIPVDLYIPGCPPHPLTVLDGLLRLIERIK